MPVKELLVLVYLINAVFIINHEIESAYWKEWNLFKLKGGITGFLLFHFPIIFLVLYGLIWLAEGKWMGYVMSFLLSAGGIFAFVIHSYFLRKGGKEFRFLISRIILFTTLVLSAAQIALTVVALTLTVKQ